METNEREVIEHAVTKKLLKTVYLIILNTQGTLITRFSGWWFNKKDDYLNIIFSVNDLQRKYRAFSLSLGIKEISSIKIVTFLLESLQPLYFLFNNQDDILLGHDYMKTIFAFIMHKQYFVIIISFISV